MSHESTTYLSFVSSLLFIARHKYKTFWIRYVQFSERMLDRDITIKRQVHVLWFIRKIVIRANKTISNARIDLDLFASDAKEKNEPMMCCVSKSNKDIDLDFMIASYKIDDQLSQLNGLTRDLKNEFEQAAKNEYQTKKKEFRIKLTGISYMYKADKYIRHHKKMLPWNKYTTDKLNLFCISKNTILNRENLNELIEELQVKEYRNKIVCRSSINVVDVIADTASYLKKFLRNLKLNCSNTFNNEKDKIKREYLKKKSCTIICNNCHLLKFSNDRISILTSDCGPTLQELLNKKKIDEKQIEEKICLLQSILE
ncbi:hypothetical protein RFI_18926 [Reticulomyxa filosa]|uniref:Uncharacterized protein n=1 Tax=Reticulomyxa filosa TaxID=46433 RepID=X6MWH6_RETFI|nr:hypothetical protein RFI_18926 [Reticulomyxa filosa]|eukprot:ETO18348.1 hypothetical protein RFI_18926 [Reticulomyxa filosa]